MSKRAALGIQQFEFVLPPERHIVHELRGVLQDGAAITPDIMFEIVRGLQPVELVHRRMQRLLAYCRRWLQVRVGELNLSHETHAGRQTVHPYTPIE